MSVETKLPKAYDPKGVEGKWYDFWMKGGYFTPKIDPEKKPFTIIFPPTNVTGEIHLGHALTATIEDILIRWHRMRGEPTLWLPGTDHAGIIAQLVVEQQLAKEGLSRHQLGREKFLERMWEWTHKYRQVITEQHKKLGVSWDWTRMRFTLAEGPSRAVRTTFVRLYEKGLIYRGERIINWCPRCATAISDLELAHRQVQGHLYYVKYPVVDGGFIMVATTRPETILGDTVVAVNPKDDRYRSFVGRKAILPVIKREIPIIADEAVDPQFGTGAVKITPAHDPVDFEVAQRQGLPSVNILNPDGTMNENAGPYQGQDRFQCRQNLLEQLKREGLLEKVEPHLHAVAHCERCGTMVEPWLSKQWFVHIAPLAQPAIDVVRRGEIKIIPEAFTKVYLNWMENIRDWCISRQLWWGHRIPVWYCRNCGGLMVAIDEPAQCQHCSSKDIYQDPDVLDTWFSSALWPHSTLGWPDPTSDDFQYYYPTTVMETGYDILFFWVARMIMMGLENTGRVPFYYVLLNGLIRDEKGEKMSKSRGNVLNPLDLTERYGTDALRFALTTGNAPGHDLNLTPARLEAGRNFANKLWNSARFVISCLQENPSLPITPETVEDRWILSRLSRLVDRVNELLQAFELGEAEREIHDFLWGEYCDWYIELAKLCLRRGENPLPVLLQVLETCLRLLHPYMPFITEEVYHHLSPYLKDPSPALIVAPYPSRGEGRDLAAEGEMELVIDIIRALRRVRTDLRIEPQRWIETQVYVQDRYDLVSHREAIEALARSRPLLLSSMQEKPASVKGQVLVLSGAQVVLPLTEVDRERERQRLEKERQELLRVMAGWEQRCQDPTFRQHAPAEVVQDMEQKLASAQDRLQRLEALIASLS